MLKRHLNAGEDFILVSHGGLRMWIRRNSEGHADIVVEHEGEKLSIGLGREKREGRVQFYGIFDGPRSFAVTPSQHLFNNQRGGGHGSDQPETQQAPQRGTGAATTLQPKRTS